MGRAGSGAERAADAVFALVAVLILFGAAEWALDTYWPFPADRLRGGRESLRLLAADGTVLRVAPTAAGERRVRVPLADISPHVVAALVAAEDRRFWRHRGVDPLALARAATFNLVRRRVVSGASTLTMQVVRLVEPRPRTLGSKAIEVLRARQLERRVPKAAILEAYLNLAPFGGTLRGVEAASLHWFGKHSADLGPAEAAMLVAMLPAPSRRAPDRWPDRLRDSRNRVLARMSATGVLAEAASDRAAAGALGARRHGWPFLAPHYCDALAAGTDAEGALRTSLDIALQRRIEALVRTGDDAGVDGVAVVVVERESGALRALIGSRDYRRWPLDASRCRRAAGSTLKPFLFALALESGVIGPDSLIADRRVSFGDWEPVNFTRDHTGSIHAAEALITSRNIPAVHLLAAVGVDRFRELLWRLGLPVGGRLGLDAALGTLAVSPRELARAYATFFGPDAAAAGVSAWTRAQVLGALGRHSPAPEIVAPAVLAWKTGTSSGRRDAWCVGVTADRVAVVWLGNLDGRGAPDLVGGRTAAALLATVVAGP